jgi:predicted DNA-binding transcriptional regulator AlpA
MSTETTKLLDTAEAAVYLRLATQTLAKWRSQGRGPSFVRLGGSVFYRLSELDQFIEAGVTAPEKK